MEKMYYVDVDGNCTLVLARNETHAKNLVRRDVGIHADISACREATAEDIEWIQNMGGYIPERGKK
jgi:predicted RNase H-related nuclease YkuK (DUF458 family)